MRLLHTSDWHLGRSLHEAHLHEEQQEALNQIVALASEYQVDAVLVAGDIYDRAIPPPEAIQLLDATLTRLAIEKGIKVLFAPGNHDSAVRLGYGSKLLAKQGIHVVSDLIQARAPITLNDAFGEVEFFLLPFIEPAEVRTHFQDESIHGQEEALQRVIASLAPKQGRKVLMAHAFVTGASVSDSERPLSVGGTGAVTAETFAGFNYVALGHLHRPQKISGVPVWYSGSIFPYSFSEAGQLKSVNLVELDAAGNVKVTLLPLSSKRKVRRISGSLQVLLEMGKADSVEKEDYLEAIIQDEGPLLQPFERLRALYPNLLHIQRPYLQRTASGSAVLASDHRRFSDLDLFARFFLSVDGRALNEAENQTLAAILEMVARQNRESETPTASATETRVLPQ